MFRDTLGRETEPPIREARGGEDERFEREMRGIKDYVAKELAQLPPKEMSVSRPPPSASAALTPEEKKNQWTIAKIYSKAAGLGNTPQGTGVNFWLALALVISIIDLLPLFGGYYKGFQITSNIFTKQTLIAISSSVFFAGLIFGRVIGGFLENKVRIFPFVLYLFLAQIAAGGITFVSDSYGLGIGIPSSIYWTPILAGLSILAFLIFVFHDKRENITFITREDFAYFVYVYVLSILLINAAAAWIPDAGLGFSLTAIKPLLHLAFLFAFINLFVKTMEEEEGRFHLIAAALLIFDFFGTYLYSSWGLVKYIPALFIGVVFYASQRARTKLVIASYFFIGILVFASYINIAQAKDNTLVQLEETDKGEGWMGTWNWIQSTLGNAVKTRIDQATKFSGQVEQNQYESLGVYFSSLKAAQPRFYTDEPIVVWGSIRSKTYQDAIIITPSCYKAKDTRTKEREGVMVPKGPFPIFQLEETDFECTFEPSSFNAGSHTITLESQYNFATNAYQKAYFMDITRYRSYIRENIDPLTQLGIKEKNPSTIYTNGPVEIGIKVGSESLIRVGESQILNPLLFITVTNRQQIEDKDKKIITRWEGKVQKVNELIILTPPGVSIPEPSKCKPAPFKEFDESSCLDSCGRDTPDDPSSCIKVCLPLKNSVDCTNECVRAITKCRQDCSYLFKGDEGTDTLYSGYALDTSNINSRFVLDSQDTEDKFKTFSCQILATQNVLDNAPITIRYFRARAKYDYSLKNTITLNIVDSPDRRQVPAVTQYPSIESRGVFNAQFQDQNVLLNNPGTVMGAGEKKYSTDVLSAAKANNVDYFLMKAIIQQGSGWNPSYERSEQVKKEDGTTISDYRVGLMQIPMSRAAQIGCIAPEIPPADYKSHLKNTNINLDCGAKLIKSLMLGNVGTRDIIAGFYEGGQAIEEKRVQGKVLKAWEDENDLSYASTRSFVYAVVGHYNQLLNKVSGVPGSSATVFTPQITFNFDTKDRPFNWIAESGPLDVHWTVDRSFEQSKSISQYTVNRYSGSQFEKEVCITKAATATNYYTCTDGDATMEKEYRYEIVAQIDGSTGSGVAANYKAYQNFRIPDTARPLGP